MTPHELWTSFYTIVRKDVRRIVRIWPQTFLPSVITSVLYFLVFGVVLGRNIGPIGGFDYIHFVVPGLVMLAVVTNAFSNVATVMFTAKFFTRSIDEILISPTPPWLLVAGFVTTGIVRGVVVGLLVLLVSIFFALPPLAHPFIILAFLVLASTTFALFGLINGIVAKSFDGISIIPTFVLTPLVYLGGVFYSAQTLPSWWHTLTLMDPIFYIINGFRYGFLGISDVPLWLSFGVLGVFIATGIAINIYFVRIGLGLRQ